MHKWHTSGNIIAPRRGWRDDFGNGEAQNGTDSGIFGDCLSCWSRRSASRGAFFRPAPQAVTGGPINAGDVAWMLTATGLVLLMTPGLSFFYGGMVRVEERRLDDAAELRRDGR